MVALNLMALG